MLISDRSSWATFVIDRAKELGGSLVTWLPFGKEDKRERTIANNNNNNNMHITRGIIRSPENASISGAFRRPAAAAAAAVAASRIDRGDNDNCIVASRPATTTRRRAEISVSVIIVMPTIGGAQRELDTHVQTRKRSRPHVATRRRAAEQ